GRGLLHVLDGAAGHERAVAGDHMVDFRDLAVLDAETDVAGPRAGALDRAAAVFCTVARISAFEMSVAIPRGRCWAGGVVWACAVWACSWPTTASPNTKARAVFMVASSLMAATLKR